MQDDLNRPLGLDRDGPALAQGQRDIPYVRLALGGCTLVAVSLMVFPYTLGDRRDGEPFAIAHVEAPRPPPGPPAAASTPPAAGAAQDDQTGSIGKSRNQVSAAEVEARSGVKVSRQGAAAPGALIIQIEQPIGMRLNPAPDKRLIEKGAAGLLPKIGADGARPAEVYARPVMTSAKLKPGAPRIALIVGGLGLNAEATSAAVGLLPDAVTLGFAPYGADLERQVARAREEGHEVILQVPMEPVDFPANDPGPHTLTTAAAPAQLTDHLRWHLARFTGYVGVGNFLGGKFMADGPAFSAALREIGARGLFFVDDGTAPLGLTAKLAPALGVQALAADVAIDADPKAEAVEAALVRLETLARAKGGATGVAQALPGNVERIARFAKALEGRGVALVPASALAGRPLAVAERPGTP